MYELEKVLQEKKFGLYYGSRVILPFVVDILKAVIDDDLITDFSPMSEIAYYEKQDKFTEIYFLEHEDILKDVSKYETIKLVVVHEDDDMFNFDHHIQLSLNPVDHHKLEISQVGDDVLFIE